jgi:hypothetical protein
MTNQVMSPTASNRRPTSTARARRVSFGDFWPTADGFSARHHVRISEIGRMGVGDAEVS